MNRAVLAPACACAAALVAAARVPAADLSLNFVAEGPGDGGPVPSSVAFHPSPGVPHYFDLVFRETGTPLNEGLFSYDVAVRLVRPRPLAPPDVRFLTGAAAATIPPDNFVLPPTSRPPAITVLESDADHMIFNITSGSQDPQDLNSLGDINTADKAARIWYLVEPGTPEATYRLQFIADTTIFGSANPNLPLEIPVDTTGEGAIVTPEPSALSLLAGAGLLCLRRRRAEGAAQPEVG